MKTLEQREGHHWSKSIHLPGRLLHHRQIATNTKSQTVTNLTWAEKLERCQDGVERSPEIVLHNWNWNLFRVYRKSQYVNTTYWQYVQLSAGKAVLERHGVMKNHWGLLSCHHTLSRKYKKAFHRVKSHQSSRTILKEISQFEHNCLKNDVLIDVFGLDTSLKILLKTFAILTTDSFDQFCFVLCWLCIEVQYHVFIELF